MVDDIKVGRNEPCPCGSGRKYKKCCLSKKGINLGKKRELSTDKFRIQLKNKDDVQGIREAGALTLEALDLAEVHLKPGIKTADIDKLIHEFIVKNNAIPAPLNYKGYPTRSRRKKDRICRKRVFKAGYIHGTAWQYCR